MTVATVTDPATTDAPSAVLAQLDELEARAAVRRVMASYIDACDVEKDPELIADHFTPDGIWQGVGKGEEFGRNVGRAAIVEMFTVNPSRQPWTVHYLTSERIDVDCDTARGRWQCLEASVIRHGRQGVWMGVTYDNDFVRTPDGWRLSHIRCGEEFITPYDQGWHLEADMQVIDDTVDGPGIPDSLVHRPLEVHDTVPGAISGASVTGGSISGGTVEERLERLEAERAVRRLMGAHLGSLDAGEGGAAVDEHFTPDAAWVGLGAYEAVAGPGGRCEGRDAIAELLDERRAAFPERTHHLANEWIEVDDGPGSPERAVGRWICLEPSTAADGTAWWVGTRFRVECRRTEDGWRIAELRVRDIVTAPYDGGWLAAGSPGGSA